MPDSNLKAAMEEIKAVLKKHDCAGMIALTSESHVEYLNEFKASWSCAWIEEFPDGSVGVRVRAKRKDFPSHEAQNKAVSLTVGMFLAFANMAEKQQAQIKDILAMLLPHFGEVKHWEKDE